MEVHFSVVQDKGVRGLCKRRNFAVGINVIPFAEIGKHLFEGGVVPLCKHLVQAALGADLFICSHENLELRIGEHRGSNVTSVHDNAAAGGEGVELVVHKVTYPADCADGTYVRGDFQSADFLLYAAFPEKELRGAVNAAEMKVQGAYDILETGFIYGSVFSYETVFHGIQGDAPVHCAAVQIQEAESPCHHLCESAFSRGRAPVHRYYNIRNNHDTKINIFYDICINKHIPMKVLVIDDERAIRYSMKEILEMEGYEVETAENGEEGLSKAEKEKYDAIFCDIKMPVMDGTEFLAKAIEAGIESPVIMVSGHADIQTAVDCIKKGAFDFIEKPLDLNRILITLKNATDKASLVTQTKILKKKVYGQQMVGESEGINRVREIIEKVAPTDAGVLITGPNGSGKELVARALHQQSQRSMMPYVEVNCAAIPSELIESELFGHEKGSFTSAIKQHKGKFEQADGGTLFLDEIGDMSLAAQAKVLRVLQERRISRVGSDKDIVVNVRVIAATNKNLQDEISKGNFREDLYHRLSVIVIKVPTLDQRKDDIPLLVAHFLDQICSESAMPRKEFSKEAIDLLVQKSWTGNIRELRNVVERLLILGGNPVSAQDVKDYVI